MKHASVSEFVEKVQTWDPRKQGAGSTIRYIDIGSVSQVAKVIEEPPVIQAEEAPSRARQLVKAGDILISTVRPNLNAVALVPDDLDGATASTGFSILRPDDTQLDRNYLFHWVRTQAFISEMMRQATGQSYPAVSDKIVKASKIPLPPLEEQRRIAGILDQADALRRLRTRVFDKLNTLGQAIFHEMFGDVANNTKNLSKAAVGDHCERVSVGVVIKPASHYQDDGVPAIRGTNIKPDGIDLSDIVYFSEAANNGPLKKSRISTGDVLAVRSGRPGLAAVVPPELDGANCIDVLIATTKKDTLLPEYLRDFLNSPDGRRIVLSNSVGQVQQHFNVKSLAGAEIPLPSIDQQHVYLKRATALQGKRYDLVKAAQSQDRLFASLQHRAFRGEL